MVVHTGIHRIVWDHPTLSQSLLSGGYLLAWGLTYGTHPETFEVHDYLSRWASPSMWGTALFLLGVVQLIHVLVIRTHSDTFHGVWWVRLHQMISLAAVGVWGYILIVSIAEVPPHFSVVLYGGLAVGAIWEFIRSGE